jgi:hypothetical protein
MKSFDYERDRQSKIMRVTSGISVGYGVRIGGRTGCGLRAGYYHRAIHQSMGVLLYTGLTVHFLYEVGQAGRQQATNLDPVPSDQT